MQTVKIQGRHALGGENGFNGMYLVDYLPLYETDGAKHGCVIRKLVLKADVNQPMKFNKKSLIETLRLKNE
ncbi:MAG: hypothetical protein KKE23_01235, partial [Nanoarchaeota archaeon]|nr:hypothetical protein [Nanoarchaeota archaeon]